ncbi:ABC transporter permease [Ornithinimicrobium panacihumi]|uniref:ABC transporter permease n=1 Tax=Ornithinimicrobium panacihumi TaxID=2008449 RepID=UPI003F8A54A2
MAGSWMTGGLASRGRRLLSAAVAIIIGVAFLTTSLAVLLSAKAGLEDAVGAGLRDADLVLTGQAFVPKDYDAVAAAQGVGSVTGEAFVFSERGPDSYVSGTNLATSGLTLLEGRMPQAEGEIVVNDDLAEAGFGAGEELRLTSMPMDEDAQPATVVLDVVGVVKAGDFSPISFGEGFLADDATLRLVDPMVTYQSIRVDVADEASVDTVRETLAGALPDATITTGPEAAEERVSAMTGGTAVMGAILLGFGAVALATAAIVIANTFTITLAQRTGELALLRCVGATKQQVRRSVLLEALLLGLVASAVGVLLGLVGAWGLVRLGERMDLGLPLGSGLSIDPVTVLAPLAVGTVVTLFAPLWPATRATRVSPLAALRPTGESSERTRISLVRVGLAGLLVAGGTALMVYAATNRDVLSGILGGFVSFAGVLVGAAVIVPAAVRALGLGARAAGVPGKLAVDNAVRNPGRVAATSAALIVGVTLITMTSVGAASGQRTALGEIDKEYAVDLVAETVPEAVEALPADGPAEEATGGEGDGGEGGRVQDQMVPAAVPSTVPAELAAVEGVAAALPVDTAYLTMDEAWGETLAIGLDPATAGQVIRSQALVDSVRPGVVGMSDMQLLIHGLEVGDTLPVHGSAGSKDLTVIELGMGSSTIVLHADDLAALDGDQVGRGAVLLTLEDKADIGQAFKDIEAVTQDATMNVSGSAAERARITQILDVMVLITTALLGVAVLIAVVGIANTLSLSIIERHREHALLRGLGLTRGQMRTMLLVEGVLIALVSAVLGLLLGVGYAALGIQTILPEDTALDLAIPWSRVGIIVGVALLAGVLSSVLPARRATRVSPAEGLAAA